MRQLRARPILALWRLFSLLILILIDPLTVGAAAMIDYHILPQALSTALIAFGDTSDVQVLHTATITSGLRSPGVSGRLTPPQALRRLLAGTPLDYRYSDSHTITVVEASGNATVAKPAVTKNSIRPPRIVARTPPSKPAPGQYPSARKEEPAMLGEIMVEGKNENDTAYNVYTTSTATRTDTPILETPFSIQVVPQQVIQDTQTFRLDDILKNVSGVRGVNTFNPAYQETISRGFAADLLRNGYRTYSLTVPVANAERVEVLKGPAAVQYGRIEPGGAVNVITKKPQEQAYYALQQQFGSYDLYRTTLDATGPVTRDKTLLYRLNFEYLDRSTFQDFTFADRVFVNPTLTWRPSANTEVDLSFEYRNDRQTGRGGFPALGNRPAPVPVPVTRSFQDQGLNDNFDIYATYLKLSHRFNDQWTMRVGTGIWIGDYKFGDFSFNSVDPTTRTVQRGVIVSNFDKRNNYDAYLDLVGHFNAFGLEHTVLIGTDYSRFDDDSNWFGNNSGQVNIPPLDIFRPVYGGIDMQALKTSPPDNFFVTSRSWNGIYFQDQIAVGKQWRVLGGGRYDWADFSSGFAPTSLADAKDKARSTSLSSEQFSPRVGVVYLPRPWISFYGSYTESFGAPNGGRSRVKSTFSPETADQYEVGVKTDLFGGRLSSSLAFYHLSKQHILTTDPADPVFSAAVGEARSQGIEFDISGRLSDAVSLIASYAYTDNVITRDNSGLKGHRLPNVPRHTGSAWLKYEFQQPLLRGLSLGAGAYIVSQVQGDTGNTFQLPGYVRFDAFAAYAMKLGKSKLTTQINLDNFLDKRYFAASSYNADILPGEPLTVLGSLRLEY